MKPMTRIETYLATAADDPDAPATLPEPVTREEIYLSELCKKIADIGDISPEDIQAAVTDYLDEHPAIGRAATDEEFEEAMNNA